MDVDANVIVLGEQITGLYAGIRSLEKGYTVCILEKNNKQCTISEEKLIVSETHYSLKKLLVKNGITFSIIDNKITELLNMLIEKCDKLPIPLQKNIIFEEMCNTLLHPNDMLLLKTRFKDYFKFKTMVAFNACALIRKNYLNKEQYIINEGISFLLDKLRTRFLGLGGKIYYVSHVKMITIERSYESFKCFTKNRTFRSNIIISTLNLANTLKIYKWNEQQLNVLKNIVSVPRKIFNETKIRRASDKLLQNFNISIPSNIVNDKKHYLWKDLLNVVKYYNKIKTIMGENIHFYICNDCFSKNQGWIAGAIDMVNDTMTKI